MSTENRKLADLRVVDLQCELEKRGLDKTGTRPVLFKRLKKAIEDEGLDLGTYQFHNSPAKQSSTVEIKEESNAKGDEAKTDNNDTDAGSSFIDIKKPKEEVAEADEKALTSIKLESDNSLIECDNVLQLTLDEGETFLEEKVDTVAAHVKLEKSESDDTMNTSHKTVDAVSATAVSCEKRTHDKKVDENASYEGASKVTSAASHQSDSQNCNLWIKNIASTTRATQLKEALSSYGKVIGAKVVTNAKYPGTCYGYVTMNTVEDANNCIAKLNNTELNGCIIRIAKVRSDHVNSLKLNTKLSDSNSSKHKHRSKSHDRKGNAKKDASSSSQKQESKRKSRSRDKSRRRSVSESGRSKNESVILPYDKMIEKRERKRELLFREERARRDDKTTQRREVYRRQRTEAARLDRERIKLRKERERLDKEKEEIEKLKLQVQKLEQEQLELEQLEVQQVALSLQEEDRRLRKRSLPYRYEGSYHDRKRTVYEGPSSMHFVPPSVKAATECGPLTKIRIYEGKSVFNFFPDRDARSHQFASSGASRVPKVSQDYRSVRDERDLRFLLEQKSEVHSSRNYAYTDPSDVPFDRDSWALPNSSSKAAFHSSGAGTLSKYSWKPGEFQ